MRLGAGRVSVREHLLRRGICLPQGPMHRGQFLDMGNRNSHTSSPRDERFHRYPDRDNHAGVRRSCRHGRRPVARGECAQSWSQRRSYRGNRGGSHRRRLPPVPRLRLPVLSRRDRSPSRLSGPWEAEEKGYVRGRTRTPPCSLCTRWPARRTNLVRRSTACA